MFAYSSTNKRYHTVDYYYKQKYGAKIYRISLDIGATCPNRDGKLATTGCHFCHRPAVSSLSLLEQYAKQREEIRTKNGQGQVIAYLQQGSNTYLKIEKLAEVITTLNNTDAVAIIIATRPDCITAEFLHYLDHYQGKEIYIELGLQTLNDSTAAAFNRGYPLSTFLQAVSALRKRKINITVHLINNLPGEDSAQAVKNALLLGKLDIQMVKIHLLQIPKNSYWGLHPPAHWQPLTHEENVALLVEQIRSLPPTIVVARLTTDLQEETLDRGLIKINVLNDIDKMMAKHNYYQGDLLVDFNPHSLMRPGQHAIDATVGNGKDSKALCQFYERVTALDLNPLAIKRSRESLAGLNVELYQDDFLNIATYITPDTTFVIYNLGFLPGSDHQLTTADKSAASILNCYQALNQGTIVVTVYTRHEGGFQELLDIETKLTQAALPYLLRHGRQTYIILSK